MICIEIISNHFLVVRSKHEPALEALKSQSFYLYGDVGTGKTVLLDLIYDCLPQGYKKRVHFHTFMISLYSEFNKWNLCATMENPTVYISSPIEYIANRLIEEAWIICFDEVQLADYASCNLLEGVLKHLFLKGALIIATSNRSIENLGDISITESHDGEHPTNSDPSESMRSLKSLLKSHCTPLHLDSVHDYRASMKPGNIAYAYPVSNETDEWLDQAFSKVVGTGKSLETRFVTVYGRKVLIPISTDDGVARFTAKELFQQPLGPADYIQICNNYHTVFVDRIPKMGMGQRNEARRFLSFIDAAYESRTKLYCTADSKPEEIFTLLPREGDSVDIHEDQMHFEMIGEIAYDLALSQIDFQSLGIISGEDEIFSFKRAISRLKEMQSALYQMRPHQKQSFEPYVGTKEEKNTVIEKRRNRMLRRQAILDEIELKKNNGDEYAKLRDTVDEILGNNTDGQMEKHSLEQRYQDLDWGDEASYTSWSQKVFQKSKFNEAIEDSTIRKRAQRPKPIINEKHFWGFGWWKKATKRSISSDDKNDK